MTRVQIPCYTDRWMMGDQYGEIVKITRGRAKRGESKVAWLVNGVEIAHVKLDKSGKTVRVILEDCSEV
jgi:hypothetical protein